MPRAVRDAKIDTTTSRVKLKARAEPYWTRLAKGCAVGYRKGAKGGTWIARYRDPGGSQRYKALGAADDVLAPDGHAALSFDQAQAKARQWFAVAALEATGNEAPTGPYTIADAARDYVAWFKVHRKSAKDTKYTIDAHIVPALGKVEIARLNARKIREWHEGLTKVPARLRTKPGKTQAYAASDADAERERQRRSTANRVLTVLKALLNHAWREGKVASDDAWRRVRPFQGADAAKVRYLKADECKRLVNACALEFRPVVQGALYTGCRYGELARMAVSDFNPDSGTVTVQESKSGKARHVVLDSEGQAFFEAITAGREGGAPIFRREDGARWGKSHQSRPLADACKRAKIKPAVSFHILRHTYASLLVMNGAPLNVVAHNLGHADTRMVEKHYAHLQPSYISEAIRAAMPKLGISGKTKVVGMRPGA